MFFLTCAVQTVPCPVDQQSVLGFADVADFAALGLTPEAVLAAYVFGAGSVVAWWFIGYVISVAQGLLKKA